MATGTIRNHTVHLKSIHLRRGRYSVRLWELRGGRKIAIGRSVLVVR